MRIKEIIIIIIIKIIDFEQVMLAGYLYMKMSEVSEEQMYES